MENMWSICFFTITFIFVSREVSRKITRALVFHIFALSLLFQAPIHCKKCPPHVKICFFFFCPCWGVKLSLRKARQNHWQCATCYVISLVYALIDHSSRPMRARIPSVTVKLLIEEQFANQNFYCGIWCLTYIIIVPRRLRKGRK